MTGKNDQFYSTTTIYVNAEQLPDHSCIIAQSRAPDNQMASQVEPNNPVNNLYQNISEQIGVMACNSTSDPLNNSESSADHLQPPVPAPRVSLLKQKLKQKQEESNGQALEQRLEEIDENLNLVLKRHEEKFRLEDSLINQDFSSANHTKHHLFASNETDLYVSSEPLQHDNELPNDGELSHLTQLVGKLSKLSNKRASELNRNTYISNSDVNERFSNNYNELDEPIYSDIIFDESRRRSNVESFYDFPSPTDSIKFIDLRPPPLPPPRTKPDATELSESPNESNPKDEIRIEVNDEAATDLSEELRNPQSNLQSDLRNELHSHFKTDLFKSSPSAINNSSSLNSSLNNAHFIANSNNPFLTLHSSSDLKLNELKESLNLMRKDHLSTLNGSQKKQAPKLKKDDLLLLERQIEDFSSTVATGISTKSSSLSPPDQGYGKINRVELNESPSDDEGSLKSSYSWMDSQMNSSSNDTFSFKSAKSNNSSRSISRPAPSKPTSVIAPFSVRAPPSFSHHLDKAQQFSHNPFVKSNLDKQKTLTVQLNDELNFKLKSKESPMLARKWNENKDDFDSDNGFAKRNEFTSSAFKSNDEPHQLMPHQFAFDQQRPGDHSQKKPDPENETDRNGFSTAHDATLNYPNLNNLKEFLYKTGSNRKQFNKRWCVLSESALFYYNEEKLNLNDLKSQAKGHIELNDILFLSIIPDVICLLTNRFRKALKSIKSKANRIELYQFNVGINSENGRMHLLATESASRREAWVDQLSYRIKPKLKPSSIVYQGIDACGYLNVKIGVTGMWTKCWVVLQQRELHILMLDMNESKEGGKKNDSLIKIDLRKVMTIGYNQNAQITPCETVYETGPIFHLNRRYETVLYFQADYKMHSEEWLNSIENRWTRPENGMFEDQLLAPNSVPIAVEKCLNFISTYNGIATRQIYKACGDDSYIRIIVENLKSNSLFDWHIRPEDGFTVLDVSDALKIYLKSFPECLLTEQLYQDFLKLNFCTNYTERLNRLKLLLKRLPIVNYNTLKKMLCHFTLLIENGDENEMNLNSLAYAVSESLIFSKISAQPDISLSVGLFRDLVNSYVWLFDLSAEEVEKERRIENSLKELRRFRIKQEKDELLVGVYLFNRAWECVNVPINSTMTADDLLFYCSKIANLKESPTRLCVCEVVANNELERVIHYSEHIQQILLGWSVRWSQQDAKTNYLLIKLNNLYEELDDYFDKGLSSLSVTMFNEVRFSDENSKSFRKVFLEFSNSKFNIYKDAKMKAKALTSWSLEGLNWYLGAERKRNAPSKFCITLLDKEQPIKRQKELIVSKVISFNSGTVLAKWLAALICSEHRVSDCFSMNFHPFTNNPTADRSEFGLLCKAIKLSLQ